MSASVKLVKKNQPKIKSDLPDDTQDEEQEAPKASKNLIKTKKKPVEAETQVEQTKAKTTEKVGQEEEESTDLILKVASEVEGMTQGRAFKSIPALMESIEHDYFKLGGILAKVQGEGWFMEKGYVNFRAFVEAEVNIEYRKALYFISIYNGLVESGVAWSVVGHLGWTKLKELAGILTPDNVEEYVGLAEDMTVLQLIEYLREQRKNAANAADGKDDGEEEPTTKKLSTLTFKLYEDQKATVKAGLTKAMEEMKTEHTGVALEHIMLDYLSGEKKLKKMPTLSALMTGKSAEEVLSAFGKVFPDVTLTASVPE